MVSCDCELFLFTVESFLPCFPLCSQASNLEKLLDTCFVVWRMITTYHKQTLEHLNERGAAALANAKLEAVTKM